MQNNSVNSAQSNLTNNQITQIQPHITHLTTDRLLQTQPQSQDNILTRQERIGNHGCHNSDENICVTAWKWTLI